MPLGFPANDPRALVSGEGIVPRGEDGFPSSTPANPCGGTPPAVRRAQKGSPMPLPGPQSAKDIPGTELTLVRELPSCHFCLWQSTSVPSASILDVTFFLFLCRHQARFTSVSSGEGWQCPYFSLPHPPAPHPGTELKCEPVLRVCLPSGVPITPSTPSLPPPPPPRNCTQKFVIVHICRLGWGDPTIALRFSAMCEPNQIKAHSVLWGHK